VRFYLLLLLSVINISLFGAEKPSSGQYSARLAAALSVVETGYALSPQEESDGAVDSKPYFLYKVLTLQEWRKSEKDRAIVRGANDSDFIQLSTKKQLQKIIDREFKDKDHAVVTIITSRLPVENKLVKELNANDGDSYFNFYGPKIPFCAVSYAMVRMEQAYKASLEK